MFSFWTESVRFNPRRDKDAAVKFVVDQILSSGRLQDLTEVVKEGGSLGGMGGDPAWILDRRNSQALDDEVSWPPGSDFRAYVDPIDGYWLDHPEFFMARDEFMQYLLPALDAYVDATPSVDGAPGMLSLREALMPKSASH